MEKLNKMREPFGLGSKVVDDSFVQADEVYVVPKNPLTQLAA